MGHGDENFVLWVLQGVIACGGGGVMTLCWGCDPPVGVSWQLCSLWNISLLGVYCYLDTLFSIWHRTTFWFSIFVNISSFCVNCRMLLEPVQCPALRFPYRLLTHPPPTRRSHPQMSATWTYMYIYDPWELPSPMRDTNLFWRKMQLITPRWRYCSLIGYIPRLGPTVYPTWTNVCDREWRVINPGVTVHPPTP